MLMRLLTLGFLLLKASLKASCISAIKKISNYFSIKKEDGM